MIRGGGGPSAIVAVTCCAPNSAPSVTPAISTMMVSGPSVNVSSTPVNVMLPLAWPAGMVMDVLDGV
jgi:hypothetical protein